MLAGKCGTEVYLGLYCNDKGAEGADDDDASEDADGLVWRSLGRTMREGAHGRTSEDVRLC